MVKKTILALVLYLIIVALTITWAGHVHTVLFHSAFWGLVAAIVVGAVAGVVRAKLKQKKQALKDDEPAPRHTIGSFMEHWGTGVGIIILIVSGALLASGRKVGLIFVPEFTRSRIMALNLHFLGAFYTLIFGCYFLTDFLVSGGYKVLVPGLADIWGGTIKRYLLRKKWHDRDKYLSPQKSAFLVFTILGIIILVTGAIKVSYFILPISLNRTNSIHDIAAELLLFTLIVHILFVIAVPSHWRLFLSWFTGKERHGR
jgi:cytochrome b subunit of formate dehydrogenase